jgi:CubicO group peptidase (beta-lactamase class C family)
MRRLILAFIAFDGFARALLGQSSDQFASLRAAMHRLVDTMGSPSVAVAVAKDGRIVWEDAIGWANRERRIPATANTIYPLASISKPITATGLMVLVERGQVDLDRPINTYLATTKITGLGGDASESTVRRVLSHTAGLPLHSQFFYSDRGYSPPPVEETIRRYGNVVFPPGEVVEYSNLGYGIIGYVIERVSGQSYADFMRHEVFQPLGMTHTSIDLPPDLTRFIADRYDYNDHALPFFTFDHVGASSIYSSAHDLIRFAMFHLKNHLADQRPILRDATLDDMHQPVPPSSNGLGFGVFDGGTRLAHTGGMPGATAVMVLFPASNIAVVVLANVATRFNLTAQEFTIAREAVAAVAPERAPQHLGPPPPPSHPAALVVTPELAGDWSGTLRTYEGTIAMRLQIRLDGSIEAWIGDEPGAAVDHAIFADGRLSGAFTARIPTSDAARWPHNVSLGLLLRGGKLSGEVVANSTADRIYFSLSSYAELGRK